MTPETINKVRLITGLAVTMLLALSACRGQSAVLTREQSHLKAAAEYVLQWESSCRCSGATGESDALKAANEWTAILKAENDVTELEAKTLPAQVRDRKLRASFELRTINAPPGVTQQNLELLKSYVNRYGSEWALHEFHFRTGDNAAKEPMLKARQELDAAIGNLAEQWIRVQIAQNRQITQDELQTEAKNQVLDELALTGDLQSARDGVEIATNAVLIRKLNTQLPLIKIITAVRLEVK